MDKFLLSAFLVLFISINTGRSQTLKKWLEAAEAAYEIGDYYTALTYYEIALEFDEKQTEIWRKYAHSAMELKAYPYAEKAYMQVIGNDATDKESVYWLAYTKHRQGKYEEAQVLYERFLQEMPDSLGHLGDMSDIGIENCGYAIVERENARDLELQHLDTLVNTPDSEFAPYAAGDTLYYSSLHYRYEKDEHNPPRTYAKVLQAIKQGQGIPLAGEFNVEGRHVSNMSFNTDRTIVYYTICDYVTDDTVRCAIYNQIRLPNGEWGGANILNINQFGYTATHPSVGWDQETDREVLFFTSDRPDGKGGLDIWFSYLDEDGNPGDPINLEEINTSMNDITPFFHSPSQRLYFSSDGYESFGGYDIYNAQKQFNGWSQPYNMGMPLNSSYDETHYFRDDCTNGYFSSNRAGSIFLVEAKETCCNDIYAVMADLEVELEAFTFNAEDGSDLAGATVEIYEVVGDQEILVHSIENPTSNDYNIQLERCREYVIKTSKPGFRPSTIPLNLSEFGGDFDDEINSEFDFPKKVRRDISLEPIKVELVVKPCDTEDGNVPIYGVRALFNLINEENQTLRLVAEKENSPQNPDMSFTAYLYKSYQLHLKKEGYIDRMDTIRITETEYADLGDRIILEACLERDPFPEIRLFFDNNVPGRHPNDQTIAIYNELLQTYISRKDEFIENFTSGLSENERFPVEQASKNFFERDVAIGKEQLNEFAARIHKFLDLGNSFQIKVRGYASPRGASEYNERLSNRRITSVINDLNTYDNGALVPYIQNGQLDIITENYGESTAAADISDNLRDRKNSIFSVIASVERRVEIIVTKIETNVKE